MAVPTTEVDQIETVSEMCDEIFVDYTFREDNWGKTTLNLD